MYIIRPEQKIPAWLPLTLGGLFSALLISSVGMGLLLLRQSPEPQPVVAAAPVEPAAPVAEEPAAEVAQAPRARKSTAGRGHKSVKSHKSVVSHADARAILARHDSTDKARKRDALDKLLGM